MKEDSGVRGSGGTVGRRIQESGGLEELLKEESGVRGSGGAVAGRFTFEGGFRSQGGGAGTIPI